MKKMTIHLAPPLDSGDSLKMLCCNRHIDDLIGEKCWISCDPAKRTCGIDDEQHHQAARRDLPAGLIALFIVFGLLMLAAVFKVAFT